MAKPSLSRPAYLSVVQQPPLWIVVAHSAGARVFEWTRGSDSMKLVNEVQHPEGALQNRDIGTDRPGRSFAMGGVQYHPFSKQEDPKTHELKKFMASIAKVLEDGRNQNRFSEMVLVADPHVVGILKGQLDHQTRNRVKMTVNKNFSHLNEREIEESISHLFLDGK